MKTFCTAAPARTPRMFTSVKSRIVPAAMNFCAKGPIGKTVERADAKATAKAAIDAEAESTKLEKPLTKAVRSP